MTDNKLRNHLPSAGAQCTYALNNFGSSSMVKWLRPMLVLGIVFGRYALLGSVRTTNISDKWRYSSIALIMLTVTLYAVFTVNFSIFTCAESLCRTRNSVYINMNCTEKGLLVTYHINSLRRQSILTFMNFYHKQFTGDFDIDRFQFDTCLHPNHKCI